MDPYPYAGTVSASRFRLHDVPFVIYNRGCDYTYTPHEFCILILMSCHKSFYKPLISVHSG